MVEQCVDRKRRIGLVRLEGGGVRGENVEDPVLQRGRPALLPKVLARATPVFVAVSAMSVGQAHPSELFEHSPHISATVEIIARAFAHVRRTAAPVRIVGRHRADVRIVRRHGRTVGVVCRDVRIVGVVGRQWRIMRTVRRQWPTVAHRGRYLRTIDHRRAILVQFPRRLQQNIALGAAQARGVAQIALDDLVSGCRGAQNQATFATGFDQRDDLAVGLALGEFQVAADCHAAVDHVPPARGRDLDYEPVAQVDRDAVPPGREQFTPRIKVDGLDVARGPAAENAHRVGSFLAPAAGVGQPGR